MPAVVFPQIRVTVASIAICLLTVGCSGADVTPSEDIGTEDAPNSNPVPTTGVAVEGSDTDPGEPLTTTTTAGINSDDASTDPETPADATTTTTVAVAGATTATTEAPTASTTTAPVITVAPPTTFEVITVEPSSGPPEIETIEPTA